MDAVLAARLVKLGGEEWKGHGVWLRVKEQALFQDLEAEHHQVRDDAAFKKFCVGIKFPQEQGAPPECVNKRCRRCLRTAAGPV